MAYKFTPNNDGNFTGTLSTPFGDLPVTQGYGNTDWAKTSGYYRNNSHPGVDFASPDETIKSFTPGVVVSAQDNGDGFGGTILVKGDDGNTYKYSHSRQFSVKPGQKINMGDVLGIMGGGANDPMRGASTGRHIDFGVKLNDGTWTNPLDVITKMGENVQKKVAPKITPEMFPKLKETLKQKILTIFQTNPDLKEKLVARYKNKALLNDKTTSDGKTSVGDDYFGRIKNAIAQQESNSNYKAVGPLIPGRSDRALGKYQIMGANLPQWSQKYLGRQVGVSEFLASPDLQEKVAEGQMKSYYNSAVDLGLKGDDIARYVSTSWYAGQGTANSKIKNGKFLYDTNDLKGQAIVGGLAPSISNYGNQVISKIK